MPTTQPLEKFSTKPDSLVQHDTHYAPTDPPKKAVRFCQESTVPRPPGRGGSPIGKKNDFLFLLVNR